MSLAVVVGGQFGSEAKGSATAGLIERNRHRPIVNVRIAGPNAGHTAYDRDGRAWPFRQIPVGAVADIHPAPLLILAAGSEIDPDVLLAELYQLQQAGIRPRLIIDSEATILDEEHKRDEATRGLVGSIGSTGKGVGAARAARLLRTAQTYGSFWSSQGRTVKDLLPRPTEDTAAMLNEFARDHAALVVIEGTQGYGLGLHAGYYPQCTSSDCRAIDFLSMAGISPWVTDDLEILVCMRVYPIRVAGNSGPLKDETSWEALGLPVELTTVTRKPRRVGLWDGQLAAAAVRANPGARVHLSMLDQLPGAVTRGKYGEPVVTDVGWAFIERVERDTGTDVAVVGCDPSTVDQISLEDHSAR